MICILNDVIVTRAVRGKDGITTYATIEEGNSTFSLQSKTSDLTKLTLKRPLKIEMEVTGMVWGGGKDSKQNLYVSEYHFERLKVDDEIDQD